MKQKGIIIGGGIAGTAAALFLKRLNIKTEIYEAYERRSDVGGGFQIAPNGMRIMAELGLINAVLQKGVESSAMCFLNQHGKILAHVSQDGRRKYGLPSVNIARSAFHEILVEEVRKNEIPIFYTKRLTKIIENNKEVTAVFDDGTEARGSFLIGADGVHSKTREYVLKQGPKPMYTGMQNVGGFAPANSLRKQQLCIPSTTYFTFGRKGFFGYALCNKGSEEEVMWWSNIPEKKEFSRDELRKLRTEDIKAELRSLHNHWHEPIESIIQQSTSIFKSNIYDVDHLPKWSKNKVVLIGDAAHAMSPHAGQGASVALEDSMYLAKLLKDYQLPIERIFQKFESDRKKRVEKIIKTARRNASGKKELSAVASWFRDRFLTILLPLFAGEGQDWIHRYQIDWDSNGKS